MATKKVTTKNAAKAKKAEAKAAPAATPAAPATQTKTENKPAVTDGDFRRLRKLNLWLALLFGVQAVALLLVGGAKAVPVTAQYQAVDQLVSDMAGRQVLDVAVRHLFDVRLSVMAAKIMAVLAITCLVIATVGRPYYEAQLRRGSNLARWLAFGLGGGSMVVTLALVGGVSDIAVLFLMFVSTVLGFSLQPLAEKLKRDGHGGPLPHAICAAAIAAVLGPWLVLGAGALGALLWNGTLPASTCAMYVVTALFFGCWALASHFRVRRKGQWANTLYAERMYMFLTFASASVLVWQLYAGAL